MMRTQEGETLTAVVLAVFRANGRLLEAGDELVQHLGLTGARWQTLGAVAMAPEPLTAPRVAAVMGLTRQGAQKQLNVLTQEGLLKQLRNPGHQKSPLYALTSKGERIYQSAETAQAKWVNALARDLPVARLVTALEILEVLSERLESGRGARR